MLLADSIIGIMGPMWADYQEMNPLLRNIWHKVRPADLAIDSNCFPFLRDGPEDFNKPSVLYVGHLGKYKSPEVLEAVRLQLPDIEFGWIGLGSPGLVGWTNYGYVPLSSDEGVEIAKRHTFLLSVGYADSNPTTVLEAMCLGLIPITSPTSGWAESQGVIHLRKASPKAMGTRLRAILSQPSNTLWQQVLTNRRRVEQKFVWSEFTDLALNCIAQPQAESQAVAIDRRLKVLAMSAQVMAAIMGPRIAPSHLYHEVIRRRW
jgi:glycosyltransferase involved in cell wall biosynthesis